MDDPGFEAVRKLALTSETIACGWHGRIEFFGAMHRVFRDQRISHEGLTAALDSFEVHCENGVFQWLELTDRVRRRVEQVYRSAPATSFLRAADALHLACAAEHGFEEVYSNDRHFLLAAPLFGLRGINLIG